MDKFKNIFKRIAGTLMLPVIMYIAMYILCFSNGKTYFGTLDMWKTLIIDIGVSVTCAMGIGLQFKSGRFDFSGGGIMLITGIISGNFAVSHSSSLFMFIVLTVGLSLVLSVLVGILYVYGRIPIVITTIGMALMYESFTPLFYGEEV